MASEEKQAMEEGAEEEEDYNDSEEDTELQKAKQALTGRGVTLSDLMGEGIIHAGENLLSIDYRGQRFEADLLSSGKIRWHGAEEEFCTPSAWATHCKRLVNPIKRSGCGWASVKYKGRKLDTWKSIWSRRHHPGSPFRSTVSQLKSPHQAGLAAATETHNGSTQAATVRPHAQENGLPRADPPTTTTEAPEALTAATAAGVTGILAATTATTTTATVTSAALLPSSAVSLLTPVSNGAGKVPSRASSERFTPNIQEEALNLSVGGYKEMVFTVRTALNLSVGGYKEMVLTVRTALNLSVGGYKEMVLTVRTALNLSVGGYKEMVLTVRTALNLSVGCTKPPGTAPIAENGTGVRSSAPYRPSITYASLGPRSDARDPGTFVKCEHFEDLSRMQPFNVTISTNVLMLMDFHCHLTTSEVVGYLGGSWCPETHNVRISQAFPCRCLLSDKDKAAIVEEEIRQSMERQGCSLVGWYHSHPLCQPHPSLRDIDCQMHHQVSMKGPGGIYIPCIGLILSPYDCQNKKPESAYEAFWVMLPPEDNPNGYGMPMHVSCSVHQSSSLSEELLNEMNQLADFYRGFPTKIRWRELWNDSLSHLEKMKRSLRRKLPKDQTENSSFFSFLQQLLTRK
ncbi:hypothetical protein ACOMHN_054378 [Nucella lapillus]